VENHHRPRHALGSAAAFRPSAKQYALHPLEKALMLTVIALLVYVPWALGGMRPSAQIVAGILAVVAFVLSLIPRTYDDRYHAGGNLRLYMWPKLRRFPIFWIGLVYLALIVIQIYNPAWILRTSAKGWWLEPQAYLAWLPHGVEGTAFTKMNGWRTLLIQGGAWLLICALWVGVTRRRTLQLLLVTLTLNAVALGILAAAQRFGGTNDIFWQIPSPNEIWGTFFYRNHGAAWFNLTVAMACGLAAWFQLRALRSFAKSNPSAVLAFLAIFLGVIVIASHSRGAVLTLVGFLGAFVVAYIVRHLTLPDYPRRRIIVVILALSFIGFAGLGLRELKASRTWDRMEELFKGDRGSVESRQIATQATMEMWAKERWYGHGAGSFRYVFPQYQQHHPQIYKTGNLMFFWDYAHNDHAQALAEMGLVGFTLLAAGFVWWLYALYQRGAHGNLLAVALALGVIATVFHARVEFVLHCPAILYTAAALFVIAVLWSERDRAAG
jgi:O-antigen ligase